MPSSVLTGLLIGVAVTLAVVVTFLVYIWIRYSGIVARIFEETPVFQPLRSEPLSGGQEVRFPTADGITLSGTYLDARSANRKGVVVFCHEYLGDRASAGVYADSLRDLGFDLFAFDFRNHGESDSEPAYMPLQWISNRETRDLKAALAYLRQRPDADPAGVGLLGVSRGGSAALCVAARDARVWGVATDGAFPTRGTMLVYIKRWAEIYVGNTFFWRLMPDSVFHFVGWAGRMRTQMRLGRRFADVERAIASIGPRPIMMIHGEKDNYIGPEIAESLFALASSPKEFWLVPGAKHNRCREVDPAGYRARIDSFFSRFAPRRPADPSAPADEQDAAVVAVVAVALHD
ncbi:MAG: putative lysophospholipase [Planctomycetota bacterium]|nr:putative lysophospholipase [Planctomycetota bacterium]